MGVMMHEIATRYIIIISPWLFVSVWSDHVIRMSPFEEFNFKWMSQLEHKVKEGVRCAPRC
jgi:hypothetical protein